MVIAMPYRSPRQRRYMHARHPRIAARWDRETRRRRIATRLTRRRKR